MADFWDQVLTAAATSTAAVGQRLLAEFGGVEADVKSDGSLVTASDRWADQALRTALHHHFPDHGLLSEEVAHIFPAGDWCWVIDPIDGTTNFSRGIPIWGISLGLLYRGVPVFGYVAIPPCSNASTATGPAAVAWSCPGAPFATSAPSAPAPPPPDPSSFSVSVPAVPG